MKISKKSKDIQPSLTRQLFNMAKNYNDVIDLTLGDPDLAPPVEIKKAACRAIENNLTHYSANAGLLQAREAIAKHIYENWKVYCDPNKNVSITVGGMQALYMALLSIVEEGDEVIVFAPYYPNYIQMIKMCGGTPIVINAYEENRGFVFEERDIEKHITEKTVAIIINSPNNPTGAILTKKTLKMIAGIAKKHDLIIISDEVYRTLVYGGKKSDSILQINDAKERTVLIDSLSKEYSMTGWRIGYAYGPEEIISSMIKFQENIAACVPLPSQYALIEAYESNIGNEYIVSEFEKRRNIICELLGNNDTLSFVKPDGTFYLFVNVKSSKMKSLDFALKLLEKKHVAVVPGITYGNDYDDYIRIAFTKDASILAEASRKINEFCCELG